MVLLLQLKGFDPCSVPPMKALDVLAELFDQGLGCSTLNTARSTLHKFCLLKQESPLETCLSLDNL